MSMDKVVVAEDEPVLRMAAVTMLEEAGFEVFEASNAAEVIVILESRTDIHLVFSDIDMAHGMDGMKLAAVIRNRWPPIEIVLTSGHIVPAIVDLPARCVFLPKPYRSEAVVAALRKFGNARD